ncbi:hypothetical protein BS78_02G268100 [Paspalum vaginatum]|nr:hypothetical protein BS78_02G268100 [Paspalum vaginatum]
MNHPNERIFQRTTARERETLNSELSIPVISSDVYNKYQAQCTIAVSLGFTAHPIKRCPGAVPLDALQLPSIHRTRRATPLHPPLHWTLLLGCCSARPDQKPLPLPPPSMRHLSQAAVVEHLAAATPAPAASGGVHTDTFLILAAVLCFLLCVVGLAFVARCSRLCNPSAYSVDAEPGDEEAAASAMPAAAAPRKGIEEEALRKLPTVPFREEEGGDGEERPECAICLADFARGDEVRVLPPCAHAFHAGCVDTWLLCTSTCPSCRTALVVAPASSEDTLPCRASAQASAAPELSVVAVAVAVVVERGPCRTSVP